jgi:NADH-quinone oxidoreductase subunit G
VRRPARHRSVIDTFFDHGVEGNLWAGNIVDICPVGALLSKDFLHKARVWDLDGNASICPNCSQGCNIRIDTRDNLVMRLRPRANADVNSYWMCDYGRHRYEWMNVVDRVEAPLVRGDTASCRATSWQKAMLALVERVRAARGRGAAVTVIGSPFHGNEDNGMLARSRPCSAAATWSSAPSGRRGDRLPGLPEAGAAPRPGRQRARPRGARLHAHGGGRRRRRRRHRHRAGRRAGRRSRGLAAAPTCSSPHGAGERGGHARRLRAARHDVRRGGGHVHELRGPRAAVLAGLQPPPLARPAWQILGVLLAGLEEGGTAPATAGRRVPALGDWHDEYSGLSYDVIGSRAPHQRDGATARRGGRGA